MAYIKTRQQKSIEKISSVIAKDDSVRAIFLKGSIARGEDDIYSDVDLYCIVKEDEMDEFLEKRIDYLEHYRPLIYWSESNFVGPQIVGVFDDGLHFDLYTITYDMLQNSDKIKVLYDPQSLLGDYKYEKKDVSNKDIGDCFNSFTFTLLEFEAAYCRNDLLWASRLGSHLIGDISIILSYIYDKEKPFLGLKRLHKSLDNELYNKLLEVNDLINPSNLPIGVIKLCEVARDILEKLSDDISSNINKNFFYFMFDKVKRLEEK